MMDERPFDDTRNGDERQGAETLRGTLRSIVFHNADTGFTVGRFDVENELFPIVATGEMLGPAVGDSFEFTGGWVQHPRYGKQFKWTSYQVAYPVTSEGIERYISSGVLPGIGPALAHAIVRRFGTDTLHVLDAEPGRLAEIGGIGPKKLAGIRRAWEEQRGVAAVMVFLKSHGAAGGHAVAIFRAYGAEAVSVLRADPYRMIEEVDGIGFVTADRIARGLGIDANHPKRLRAGLVYTLGEAARSNGHTFLPSEQLIHAATALLEGDTEAVRGALGETLREGLLAHEDDAVYLPELLAAEHAVVADVQRLTAKGPRAVDHLAVEGVLRDLEKRRSWEFAPVQSEAVHKALAGPMTVVTGGPGTGKTSSIAGIIAAARALELRPALCAPTGRAAKRLSELAGFEAKTIHRLLEVDPATRGFQRNADNRLEVDVLIVDEMSMVDIQLMAALLDAVPDPARVVLVGDVDQLPSVGPGNVLRDIIDAGCAETTALHLNYRQGVDSRIVSNAHRVREGFMPVFERDTFFVDAETPEETATLVRDIVAHRIPREMGFEPVSHIQVLTPMHGTAAGVAALNAALRTELNPHGRVVYRKGEQTWHIGDKVMQVRNDYEKDVFNGDIGIISSVDPEESRAIVSFDDGRVVAYSFEELADLVHAYAITIHKSQGSEYDVVVLPLVLQHRIMLQRNLLYTAMTRARSLLVLVGQRQALATAVRNERIARRFSGLRDTLRRALA